MQIEKKKKWPQIKEKKRAFDRCFFFSSLSRLSRLFLLVLGAHFCSCHHCSYLNCMPHSFAQKLTQHVVCMSSFFFLLYAYPVWIRFVEQVHMGRVSLDHRDLRINIQNENGYRFRKKSTEQIHNFLFCSFKTSAFICTIWFDLYDLQSCFMNNNNITVYFLFFLCSDQLSFALRCRFNHEHSILRIDLNFLFQLFDELFPAKKPIECWIFHRVTWKLVPNIIIFCMKHLARIYIKMNRFILHFRARQSHHTIYFAKIWHKKKQ